VVSTGDEILPEHLNLPEPASLQQIELQLKQILAEGSATETLCKYLQAGLL
jgi:hypothetical protein